MKRLFVTRRIPTVGLDILTVRTDLDVKLFPKDKIIPRADLLAGVKGADAILTILTDSIDAEVMDAAGAQLKLIVNYAVGFDNIDVNEAKKRGITIANATTTNIAESVAEHTVALIFALAHRIVEGDEFARLGRYTGWGPELLLGTDVIGKTIGIIGTGAIGSAVARRFHAGFGVNVLYTDIKRNEKLEAETQARYVELDELLHAADFVSIHVPLLPNTRHLIGERELGLMKKTAFLVNTSRGPIVDEHALVNALSQGVIGGAGIDVYECEPMLACDPLDAKALRSMPNVVLTPHTASATRETRDAMSRQAAANVIAWLDGTPLPNAIPS